MNSLVSFVSLLHIKMLYFKACRANLNAADVDGHKTVNLFQLSAF